MVTILNTMIEHDCFFVEEILDDKVLFLLFFGLDPSVASEDFPVKLIEVTTNIECGEFRRCQNVEIVYEENPHGSETDDLECLFCMCHSWLGLILH